VADVFWHTKEDYKKLNEWGFNLVRLLVFWEALEPIKGQYNLEYIQKVCQHIQWLKELKIEVLLDFHQDLFAHKFTGNGFPSWAIIDNSKSFKKQEPWNKNYFQPAVLESYKNFWKNKDLQVSYIKAISTLINNIKSFDNIVGIDVMNEPFPVSPFFLSFENKNLTDLYELLQTAIKQANPNIHMFFEPWMSTSAGLPSNLSYKTNDRDVYAPHFYDPFCMENKPYEKFNRWLLKKSIEIKVREAQLLKCPIVYGEFGFPKEAKNWELGIKDFLTETDKYNTGWIYWSYDLINHGGMGLLNSDKTPNDFLKNIVRIYPQRIAGKNPSYHSTDTEFSLTYELSDATGFTEIAIPDMIDFKVLVGSYSYTYDKESRKIYYNNDTKNKTQNIVIAYSMKKD
jgi:endoglycosylceramidase